MLNSIRSSAAPAFCLLFCVLWGILAALPAFAQLGSGEIRGRAPQVIDSGLLDFAGRAVYLYGLRGLPPGQTCTLGSQQTWACGQEAGWAARNRIANHWVDCVERARGPGGELFAVCYLGGVGGPELNAWLVEQGWAEAADDYAEDYVAAEAAARAAGRGLWRGQ
ncbi:MAG: thermonuclease family protein [Kiloniellaceae bacterium]